MNIRMIRKNSIKRHYPKKKDYSHVKRVSKDFEIKYLGKYHDLYVQSNTLLLADVFETFEKKKQTRCKQSLRKTKKSS